GREDELEPGDFVLFDGAAPGRIVFGEPNTSFHLVLGAQELKARLPSPENLCGLKTSRERQYGLVVRAMLEDVWHQIERGFPQEHGLSIAKTILDVVATAYSLQRGNRCPEYSSLIQRRAYVK